jgi:hypothetical protein
MAIPSRGIGWSTVDNLLWQISKQLEQLTNVTAKGCTTTTTTTTLPVYRVYTALLTQTGVNNVIGFAGGDIVIGLTYQIYETAPTAEGYDFTNVGAPNNNIGTFFVATGTTPASWGNGNVALQYNEGAPTVIVLENTIGNIWFTCLGVGKYQCVSDNLFTQDKTTVFISDTVNGKSDTFIPPLQMRVLCSIDISKQPGALSIFTGAVDGTPADDIITNISNLQFYVTFEIRVYN